MGSRPCAFQQAMDEPCTLPISPPKSGTKMIMLFLPVKFNFCRKKSATKFLCVTPFQHNDFDQCLLIALTVRASKEVQLSLIGSWQWPFYRAKPCALLKVPQRVAQNENFLTFGIALHIVIAGSRRHFTFGVWVVHSKSQPTDNKSSLKWAWSCHVTHF